MHLRRLHLVTRCCTGIDERPAKRWQHRGLVCKLWRLFVAGSFAFGFALVPLYDVLCSITGLGNQKSLTRAVALAHDPAD